VEEQFIALLTKKEKRKRKTSEETGRSQFKNKQEESKTSATPCQRML